MAQLVITYLCAGVVVLAVVAVSVTCTAAWLLTWRMPAEQAVTAGQ